MKAVQYKEYGGPEVLEVVDVDEPHAGPGQVRIAVHAAGVNPFDWKVRSGAMAKMMPVRFPTRLGYDASGVVDEVGDGVDGVSVGDAVFGTAVAGATAEFTVLSEWAKKPDDLSFEEAAGYPMVTETARRALNLLSPRAGQTLLVNGAAGGVGLAAVQFALADGLTVIGTASEKHHEQLRSLGVIPTTYGEGLAERVRQLAQNGVDVALDTAGAGELPQLIEVTGTADKVVTIADNDAQRYGVRFAVGSKGHAPEARAEAADLHTKGKFTLPVAEVFKLDDAAAAHARSEQRHGLGKYVIKVR